MSISHFHACSKVLFFIVNYFMVFLACCSMHSVPMCISLILTQVASSSAVSNTPGASYVPVNTEMCRDASVRVKSPCIQHVDQLGRVEMDCSRKDITEISASWFPCDLSKLSLDRNALTTLKNASFAHLQKLLWLSIKYNRIQRIEPATFDSLVNLQYLNLENNRLSLSSWSYPPGLFSPLQRLQTLRIAAQTSGTPVSYPRDFVFNMPSLEALSIPSIGDLVLCVSSELCQLNNLTRLEISGSNIQITNSSFEALECLPLVELSLRDMWYLSTVEFDALWPVAKTLRSFHMTNVYVGVQNAMRMLKPLQGSHMYEISFRKIQQSLLNPALAITSRDGVLDVHSVKFLKNICVERLLILKSDLFAAEPSAFPSHSRLWSCLRYIDTTGNSLSGTTLALNRVLTLPCIETVVIMKKGVDVTVTEMERSIQILNTPLKSSIPVQVSAQCDHLRSMYVGEQKPSRPQITKQSLFSNITDIHQIVRRADPSTFYMSMTLKAVLCHFNLASLTLADELRFVGGQSLEKLSCRKCGFFDATGTVTGLKSIKELDLSLNDLSKLRPRLTEHLTGVETLILSNDNPNPISMSRESDQVFQTMSNLSSLDLSYNSLVALSPGTFRLNEKLQSINLSDNKFSDIPFDITFTPQLRRLDLSKNAIVLLSDTQRQELDLHGSKVEEFHLVLSQNILSCSCNAISFLRWLGTTTVYLDNHGNYTCLTTQGHLSATSAHRDPRALWRACYGGFYLWLSFVLLAFIIIGFLAVVLVSRHGNYIRAAVFKIVYSSFRMKTVHDYPIGVFLGYAERDYRFPCFRLLPYLESLGLSVYVRDRDSLPNHDVATTIMGAVQSSWRVVLVVTEAFLADDSWAEYTMRSAVFSQNPGDPARVILVVEERLLCRLPTHLLAAVADDNIVCLNRLLMCYELRQKLKALLKHNQT